MQQAKIVNKIILQVSSVWYTNIDMACNLKKTQYVRGEKINSFLKWQFSQSDNDSIKTEPWTEPMYFAQSLTCAGYTSAREWVQAGMGFHLQTPTSQR